MGPGLKWTAEVHDPHGFSWLPLAEIPLFIHEWKAEDRPIRVMWKGAVPLFRLGIYSPFCWLIAPKIPW